MLPTRVRTARSSSVRSILAALIVNPASVPATVIVSVPSVSVSCVGVMLKVEPASALNWPAGIVMLVGRVVCV